MSKYSNDESGESEDPSRWSQGWRTAITFLLFLHFFAMFVAVASNFGPVSALRGQLGAVPFVKPYLQLLHMDHGYNYHLTDASELDTEHTIEIDVNRAADSSETSTTTLRFPEIATSGIRGWRYRNFMLQVASRLTDDNAAADLPKAIAEQMLRENAIDSGIHRLRIRRHLLLAAESIDALAAEDSDPYHESRYQTAYEASLSFYKSQLNLIKQEDSGQTAIVK